MFFRGPFLIAAVLCLVCSPVAQASKAEDDTVLPIDAGRLIEMLDQVSILLKVESADDPGTEDPAMILQFALRRYNRLKNQACERGLINGRSCSGSYNPALVGGAVPHAVLRREMDEAEAQILPFWEDMCGKLDNPAQPTCQLE